MGGHRQSRWLLVLILLVVGACCIVPMGYSLVSRGMIPGVAVASPTGRQPTPVTRQPGRTPTLAPTPSPTPFLTVPIVEALASQQVTVTTQGAGLEAVKLSARNLLDVSIGLVIPVGTFFINRGSAQNMVAVRPLTVYLPDQQPVTVTVPSACANLHRAAPGRNSSFDIVASPAQKDLERLMAVLEQAQPSVVVRQVAVWIVTDDATRSQLDSIYVRRDAFSPLGGGSPAASDMAIVEAMQLVSAAGLDLTQRAIYREGVSLLRALGSSEDATRRVAAQMLGLSEQQVAPHLLATFQDGPPPLRQAAAYALGKRGDQAAVAPLRRALSDPDSGVRFSALWALADLKAVEALIEALSVPDGDLRAAAAFRLGDMEDLRAVEPLIKALRDPEPSVRNSAADALGALGDARAVAALAECLQDRDVSVRRSAARSLGLIGDEAAIEPLQARLQVETEATVSREIRDALKELGQ